MSSSTPPAESTPPTEPTESIPSIKSIGPTKSPPSPMTGKQRMLAAMRGEAVDRPPIWLREGFDLHTPLPPADDFDRGWMADPDYAALWEFAREHGDMRVGWSSGGHLNRILCTPPSRMRREVEESDGVRRVKTIIDTPKGELVGLAEARRGTRTTWTVKYPVESLGDLEKLRSIPFEVEPVSYEGYEKARAALGDRGILCMGSSSAWVVATTCMSFEQALAWSASERNLLHELLEEATQRALAVLEVVFQRDDLDTTANIGGAEQCTPPMMSPDAYAEFVTPYDGRLAAFMKEKGVAYNCHCHGHVRAALSEMVRAGFDSTDPVEPPFGGGDVTIGEAREIVGDRLTLCGNLQFDELERSTPERIRARVREILETGPRRLVVSASAGPISRMSPRMIANYRAWIEEVLEASAA